MGRVIICTGKGGVGKTSTAAAHALVSARCGNKTLLVSADMAHNMGDIFAQPVGKNITLIEDNLWALELDPYSLMREDFPDTQKSIIRLMGRGGKSIEHVSSSFIIPGFENLFSLLKIKRLYESGVYDCIIVDCAPTGETLSLLKLPELLSWYMEKFFPVGKTMLRVLSPISKLKYRVQLPSRETTDNIEKFHKNLLALQAFLKNNEIVSIRLVCIPEKMVVEETKRSFMYMNLYGYQVDGVFINRILPDDITNSFMQKIKENQQTAIQELEQVFTEIPIIRIPWYPEEIRGIHAVETVCADVFDIPDILKVRTSGTSEQYSAWEKGYVLTVPLPNSADGKVHVMRAHKDIHITVNNFNRCIPLPNSLHESKVDRVDITENSAAVYFIRSGKGESE